MATAVHSERRRHGYGHAFRMVAILRTLAMATPVGYGHGKCDLSGRRIRYVRMAARGYSY